MPKVVSGIFLLVKTPVLNFPAHATGIALVLCEYYDNTKEINVDERKNKTKIPVPAINAVDTLGAGDALHGAFCYYLTEGLTRKEALFKAFLIASKSCCYFGTHTWNDHE